eukprot:1046663-Prymnesium_polylepis.1
MHAAHGVRGESTLGMRLWCAPGPGSAERSVVRWDEGTGTLAKTARPGLAMVIFPDRLRAISAVVEFEVASSDRLDAIGGVELGVVAAEVEQRSTCSECGTVLTPSQLPLPLPLPSSQHTTLSLTFTPTLNPLPGLQPGSCARAADADRPGLGLPVRTVRVHVPPLLV